VQKKYGGRQLGDRTYDEFPADAFAVAPVPNKTTRQQVASVLNAGSEAWRNTVVQIGTRRPSAA